MCDQRVTAHLSQRESRRKIERPKEGAVPCMDIPVPRAGVAHAEQRHAGEIELPGTSNPLDEDFIFVRDDAGDGWVCPGDRTLLLRAPNDHSAAAAVQRAESSVQQY